MEAKRSLIIPQIRKIEVERTRLTPEIGKIEAKKMNWIKVKRTEAVFLKLLWSPGINSKELIPPAYALVGQSLYFLMFIKPRNRFQGMNSAGLCSLAGRYDNPIPPWFLAPIDSLKIPALYNNPIPARFLVPYETVLKLLKRLQIRAQAT
jgi:hypothetical protein